MKLTDLAQFARPHGSLVRADLVPEHISRSGWTRLHDRQILRRMQPGVSAFTNSQPSELALLEAAVLAAGQCALIDGRSAAWLWGAGSASTGPPIHIVASWRGRSPQLHGVALHRPTNLVDLNGTTRRRLAVTNPLRALLGVAAWDPSLTGSVMEELIVVGRFGIGAVSALISRHDRPGIPGIGALRDACTAWTMGDRPPDSLLEIHLGKLLAGTDIAPAVLQHPVGPYRLDCAWPELLAAVECDGREHHGRSREGFERDRDRDAWLGAQGWEIWRYSWAQIVRRANWFVANVRQRLDVRRGQLGLAHQS